MAARGGAGRPRGRGRCGRAVGSPRAPHPAAPARAVAGDRPGQEDLAERLGALLGGPGGELPGAGADPGPGPDPAPAPAPALGEALGAEAAGAELPEAVLPRLAIVGRPNVGKSALFNRLAADPARRAIVHDRPGVTRDRHYARAAWGARDYLVVDTGGLVDPARGGADVEDDAEALAGLPLELAINSQVEQAVREAEALLLVVDGQAGLTAADEELAAWARRRAGGRPIVLAVNKCESTTQGAAQAHEFWGLGLGEPFPVSALSGTGTGELLDAALAALPAFRRGVADGLPGVPAGGEGADEPLAVAIVGRPNVGKSSLLNAIVGEPRSVVSAVSGTTRDAVDTRHELPDGRRFVLVDTAGVRRRMKVEGGKDAAEQASVKQSLKAIHRADVAVLVLDACEGSTTQDFRLAEQIVQHGCACVLVVNKWDLYPDKTSTSTVEYAAGLKANLWSVEWAGVVFTSATTRQRVHKVLDAVTAAGAEHRRRLTTSTMNMVVQDSVSWRSPPMAPSGKAGKIYYCTQAAASPPTFVFFVNDPRVFTDDYRLYLERQLRKAIGFPGTPIRLLWRGKPGLSKAERLSGGR